MTTPAMADASSERCRNRRDDPQDVAMTRPDALFVLNNLGIGGSERKIVRLANRLKEEGVDVTLACLNGPYTLEHVLRRDVPLHEARAQAASSPSRALWRMRQLLLRERPATVLAVNLYQSLYVALATLLMPHRPRIVALVNTSTFRGASPVEAHLPGGAGALRSHRARLGCAAALLDQGEQRGVAEFHRGLQRRRLGALRAHAARSRPASGCAPRWE